MTDPREPREGPVIDFLDMDTVKRIERIADSVLRGAGLNLAEVYSPNSLGVIGPSMRELHEAFAMDLHRLALAAKQGNHAMQQFAEWQSLQEKPFSPSPLTPLERRP